MRAAALASVSKRLKASARPVRNFRANKARVGRAGRNYPAKTSLLMQFRVVSWNIHKGIGGADRRYRLERIVEVLQALAPDIAMLQEVAEDMPRSRFHDQ